MTHICVSKLTTIGSDNGLSPGRRQAIIWTNAGILLIGPLGTNFSEILIGIQTFSFEKIHLKMSSGKRRPSCLGLNVLMRHKIEQLAYNKTSFHRQNILCLSYDGHIWQVSLQLSCSDALQIWTRFKGLIRYKEFDIWTHSKTQWWRRKRTVSDDDRNDDGGEYSLIVITMTIKIRLLQCSLSFAICVHEQLQTWNQYAILPGKYNVQCMGEIGDSPSWQIRNSRDYIHGKFQYQLHLHHNQMHFLSFLAWTAWRCMRNGFGKSSCFFYLLYYICRGSLRPAIIQFLNMGQGNWSVITKNHRIVCLYSVSPSELNITLLSPMLKGEISQTSQRCSYMIWNTF